MLPCRSRQRTTRRDDEMSNFCSFTLLPDELSSIHLIEPSHAGDYAALTLECGDIQLTFHVNHVSVPGYRKLAVGLMDACNATMDSKKPVCRCCTLEVAHPHTCST